MTEIKITKMHGCGNDFVFMDYEEFIKTGWSKALVTTWIFQWHLRERVSPVGSDLISR